MRSNACCTCSRSRAAGHVQQVARAQGDHLLVEIYFGVDNSRLFGDGAELEGDFCFEKNVR